MARGGQGNELDAAIGRRIHAGRTARGLTQAALAEAVAVQEPTIRALEAGRHGPSIETLLSLARILDPTSSSCSAASSPLGR